MAPLSGLLAHALERYKPRPGLALARVSYEILGLIGFAPTAVRVRTVRHGRTIELLEAVANVGGRDVVRALAWRLLSQDTEGIAGGLPRAMPPPALCDPAWRRSSSCPPRPSLAPGQERPGLSGPRRGPARPREEGG